MRYFRNAKKLDSRGFDALLQEQDPFGDPGNRFDLRGYQFVTAAGLVQLIAACHALAGSGRRAVIQLDDLAVAGYLVRAGLVRCTQSVASIQPPFHPNEIKRARRHFGANTRLVEATRLRPGIALEKLLSQVSDTLIGGLGYPTGHAFRITSAVSEICQNSIDHNGRSCGFLAVQAYGVGSTRFLEAAVADYGDGMAATLARNPKNDPATSDLTAIRNALIAGVSGCDEPTRGQGLPHLLSIVCKYAGSVSVRSGSAALHYSTSRNGETTETALTVPPVPGVQVAFTLPSPIRT